MGAFTYKAKDTKGGIISGSLEAENRTAVVSRLQAMGYYPVQIDDATGDKKNALEKLDARIGRGRIRAADLAILERQLSDLISAGIPLIKALNIVASQTPNSGLKVILKSLCDDVSAGDTLAESLQKHPRIFTPLMIAMVKAGEAGGMLEDVLQRLADFSEAAEEIRGKIKSALAYPIVMIIAGAGAVAILLIVVIPRIVRIFAELNQVLPLPTQILILVTDFLSNWWWAVAGGMAMAVYGLMQYYKTKEGKRAMHVLALKTPVIGEIVLKRQIAWFSRTLGELIRNGVPILTALEIAQRVVGNVVIAEEVGKVPDSITQGSGVASAMRDSPYFPPVVVNMVAIGEETGMLPDALLKVSKSYEAQVDRAVKTMTSLLEPLIILVMGIVVGAIVISMLLPIFSLDPTGGS